MKSFRSRRAWLTAVAVSSFLLISWSPPSGDFDVTVGSGNDVDGFTNASINRNITVFRGLVTGTNNKVGSAGGLGGYSVVAGNNNVGNAHFSVIAGEGNVYADSATNLTSSARMLGVFGKNNTISNQNDSTLVTGASNTVNASNALVSGYGNTVNNTSSISYTSAAIGSGNLVVAYTGWAFGKENYVTATNAMAIGTGTYANRVESTALGRFNSSMAPEDVLVVGTGTSNTSRSTALRVTSDGGVILGRAQSDISMGVYGD